MGTFVLAQAKFHPTVDTLESYTILLQYDAILGSCGASNWIHNCKQGYLLDHHGSFSLREPEHLR